MRDTVEILGVKIDKVTEEEALSKAKEFLNGDKVSKIYTPNPEIIMSAREDAEFMEILNDADLMGRKSLKSLFHAEWQVLTLPVIFLII